MQKSRRAASPSGECVGFFETFFAFEEHLAKDAADIFLGSFGIVLMQPILGGHAELDRAFVILSEVAYGDFVAPLHVAGVNGNVFLFDAGAVGQQSF